MTVIHILIGKFNSNPMTPQSDVILRNNVSRRSIVPRRTMVGEARAIWDVGHYGKSLYLQNSESSNCICMFHYSSVICRLCRDQIFTHYNLRRRRT